MADPRIKVAIDTTFMDRRQAKGTAIWIRQIVSELQKYRDEFDITLVHREKIPEDPLYNSFKEIIIPRLPLPKFAGFFSELFFFLTTRERFDIYYYSYSRLYPIFWLAPAKKIVYAAMDGGPHTANYTAYGTNPKVSWLTRRLIRYVDIFIAISDFGSEGIQQVYNVSSNRVRTVYCGIATYFKPLENKKAIATELLEKYGIHSPYILDVSRFDPHKNILNLIHAFKMFIDENHTSHSLVFVGGRHMPDYSDEVEKLIHDLGLSELVYIAPFITDEDLPKVYNAADFFVFPSFYEGFGMPAVEAMACGTPVLISNIAALTEVTAGFAEIVDPHSPAAIAFGMKKLLNPEYKRGLSEQGLERAKVFTWAGSARSIADIFRSLAASLDK